MLVCTNMSSSKSFSSLGFDPDGMLEQEDLDYEPDIEEQSFAEEEKQETSNENLHKEDSNESDKLQMPEPSGQEDKESDRTSSDTQSFNYSTDLEKTPSVTSSFRDKMCYRNMHIDVEKDSFRNKFGEYATFNKVTLDSSDEEEAEFSDDEEVESVSNNYEPERENSIENTSNLEPAYEDEYVYDENGYEDSIISEEDLCDNSNLDDSADIQNKDYQKSNNSNQIVENNVFNPPKKKASFNFSIKVVGEKRCVLTKNIKKKRAIPWTSKVDDYLNDKEVVKLSSKDKVIPYTIENRGSHSGSSCVKDRLGENGANHNVGSILSGTSSIKDRLGLSSSSNESQKSDTFPGSFDSMFKVPLKRPPTRQKTASKNLLSVSIDQRSKKMMVTTGGGSLGSFSSGNTNRGHQDDNQDDIISLIASTKLDAGDEEDIGAFCSFKEEPVSVESFGVTEVAKIERTAQWVADPKPRRPVPQIFKGLCFNYFFYNRCKNHTCKLSHFLVTSSTHISKLPHLSQEEVVDAYNFAKEYPLFFEKIYSHFAEAFAKHDSKEKLVDMVHDIFDEASQTIPPEKGLSTIINALEKTDLSFEDAVGHLMSYIGLMVYPNLGSILLEIICSKPNLLQYWKLIRTLIIAGQKMNDRLGEKFLIHLMRIPVDLTLCREVYRHILKYQCINLPFIKKDIREPFIKICSQDDTRDIEVQNAIERNLSKARSQFETDKLLMTTNFSVPPPNFPNFGKTPAAAPASTKLTKLNFIPPSEFGSGSSLGNNPNDFATLSRQEACFVEAPPPTFAVPPPAFDGPPIRYERERNGSQSSESYGDIDDRWVDYTKRGEERRNSRGSSENDESPRRTNKRPAPPPTLTYNRAGLEYCPYKDYGRPAENKRARLNEPSTNQTNPDNTALNGGRQILKKGVAFNQIRSDPIVNNEFEDAEFNRLWEGADEWTDAHNRDVREAGRSFERAFVGAEEAGRPFDRAFPIGEEAGRSFDRAFPIGEEAGRPFDRVFPVAEQEARSQNVHRKVALVRRKTDGSVRSNEAAVSSSTDVRLTDKKPPEHPQFGTFYFDPNYEFNVSLHNLYLQALDNIDIDEDDVHLLNDCVKNSDGKIFLTLVRRYSGPKTVQNFIAMTLAHLKGTNQMIARTYHRLLDSIATEYPGYYGDINVRVILEVITMNMLFELDQRNMFEQAKDFLNIFSNWDSLVTSRLFINKRVSIVGRYLFIARLLITCKPEFTYEILIYPTLHLLESYDKWPYHPSCPIMEIFNADLADRNTVLEQFLKNAYLLNTVVVIQLYKTANKKKIWGFDVTRFVEPMVLNLINKDQIFPLKKISNEINVFYKFITNDTMRALVIVMYKNLGEGDLYRLYEKCVEKKIYQHLVRAGSLEYTINIKTNMHPREIALIIKYFFYKLKETRNMPQGTSSLKLEIKLPGEQRNHRALPMLNINTSLNQTKAIITRSLELQGISNYKSDLLNVIQVEREELLMYLDGGWE